MSIIIACAGHPVLQLMGRLTLIRLMAMEVIREYIKFYL